MRPWWQHGGQLTRQLRSRRCSLSAPPTPEHEPEPKDSAAGRFLRWLATKIDTLLCDEEMVPGEMMNGFWKPMVLHNNSLTSLAPLARETQVASEPELLQTRKT